MEHYDAIIVGAGPAGLNCAHFLSKFKKKILLIEKNKVIGPKVCAGGLTTSGMKYLRLPNRLYDFKFCEAVLNTPLQKTIVTSDYQFVSTIDRKRLGEWMLKKINKKNVKIMKGIALKEIKKDYVVLNNKEKISFDYLVGADGASSIVRNYLGLGCKKGVLAVQYIIQTNKFKKLEMFLDSNLFKSGYGWIFPHKNYVSIGCCWDVALIKEGSQLRKNLENFMQKKEIDYSKGEFQAHLINSDYRGFNFGNIFLIGDAAGLVPVLSGEGIHNALISGEEIARIIADKTYYPENMHAILRKKNIQENFFKLFKYTGVFKKIVFELFAFFLKNKLIARKLVRGWGYDI